jgi:Ca2+-transporting ATPase
MSSTSEITQQPWNKSVDEILARAEVDSGRGLDNHEVTKRHEQYGPNRLRESTSRPSWHILLDQLKSVVVILLLSASLAAALFERMIEALAIAAAIVVNTIIGFAMEFRATRAMEALQRISESTVRVRRDGEDKEISANELVPGDIVLLEAGDMIAADLRLLEANSLQCDEAALTGESVAADKNIDAIADEDVALGDRSNMVYKGTAVTQGSGHGVVVATAMQTEIGHVSQLVEKAEQSITPLEKRLNALGLADSGHRGHCCRFRLCCWQGPGGYAGNGHRSGHCGGTGRAAGSGHTGAGPGHAAHGPA